MRVLLVIFFTLLLLACEKLHRPECHGTKTIVYNSGWGTYTETCVEASHD